VDTAARARYPEAMKRAWAVLGFLSAGLLAAQQTARQYSLYTYDVNGRRVEGAGWSEVKTQTMQQSNRMIRNINGRLVSSESLQERVLVQTGTDRVVERTVQRYDSDGRPLALETIRIEGHKNRDGSETTVTTAHRQDLNGRMELYERRMAQTVKSASGESTSAVVERPGLSGTLEIAERVRSVETRSQGRIQRDAVTQRKDVNGRFSDAVREVSDQVKQPGRTTETRTVYESVAGGALQPATQSVIRTSTNPDGSEVEETSVRTPWAAGRSAGGAQQMQLSEQWLTERKPGPGNVMVETTSVAKPSLDYPDRLGAYQRVSEVMCSGNCKSEEK
jgi:hypothetical protein